ncbi:hypothetical protein C8Q74DRAFT_1272201, partial [Fomes fomentarius]
MALGQTSGLLMGFTSFLSRSVDVLPAYVGFWLRLLLDLALSRVCGPILTTAKRMAGRLRLTRRVSSCSLRLLPPHRTPPSPAQV